jgi:hypothetical protein
VTTTGATRYATFRFTSHCGWPVRSQIATELKTETGWPDYRVSLTPIFAGESVAVRPGESCTFTIQVPEHREGWRLLVRSRKVTGTYDTLCYRARQFLFHIHVDFIAEKIPAYQYTDFITPGPEMSN